MNTSLLIVRFGDAYAWIAHKRSEAYPHTSQRTGKQPALFVEHPTYTVPACPQGMQGSTEVREGQSARSFPGIIVPKEGDDGSSTLPASQLKEPNDEPGVALLHAVLQELLLTHASQRLMRTSRVFGGERRE